MLDFSVIVTSYNCEKYIEECINSILLQKNVSFELICIDDCSLDLSAEVIENISKKDSRIKLIKNFYNLGPASSRNIGLNEAVGRNICFVDGDDMMCENALENIDLFMHKYSLDIMSYAGLSFTNDKKFKEIIDVNEYKLLGEYSTVSSGLALVDALMNNGDRIRNCVFNCLSRLFVEKNNIRFKEGLRYADDNMFNFLIRAERVLYTNNIYYRRRYRSGSTVTSPKTLIHLASFLESYLEDLKCLETISATPHEGCGVYKYLNRKFQDIVDFDAHIDTLSDGNPVDGLLAEYVHKFFVRNEDRHNYLVSDEDRKMILSKRNKYIYGVKNYADMISKLFESWGILDYCYVVSGVPSIDNIRGKKVLCFSDLINDRKINFDDSCFIIATSKRYHSEIGRDLDNHGLKYCTIKI